MHRGRRKYGLRYKPWIEHQGRPILGDGGAKLLREIDELSSIRKAAEKLSIPYRSAWEHIRKIEDAIGTQVIKTHRGGAVGGGGAKLTEEGKRVLREYERYEEYLGVLSEEEEFGDVSLSLYRKIGVQNRLTGVVKELKTGDFAASARIAIDTPAVITALITTNALEELNLKVGDGIEAVVKATEVAVSKTSVLAYKLNTNSSCT